MRSLALSQEGEEDRDDQPIAGAAGAALDLDQRRQVDHAEVEIVGLDRDAARDVLLVAAAVVEAAEGVEPPGSVSSWIWPSTAKGRI